MQQDLFTPAVADYRTGFEREPLQLSTAGYRPTATPPAEDDLPWDENGNSIPADPNQEELPWFPADDCGRCGKENGALHHVHGLMVCSECEDEFYEDSSDSRDEIPPLGRR